MSQENRNMFDKAPYHYQLMNTSNEEQYKDHPNPKSEQTENKNYNDGTTLYVTNLSSKIDTEKLENIFKDYGTIQKCYVICNPITKESRNFGFVTFESQGDAQRAMENMNEQNVEGKTIKVELARRNEPHEPTPGQYKGVRGLRKHNMKQSYRRRYGNPYDRKRYETRRYNQYYDERKRGSSRNRYRHQTDRPYRYKHKTDYRDYDRRSYGSRSVGRRSIDRKSYDRKSYDRKSYDRKSYRKSYDRKSYDRKYHGKRRTHKRSTDRYPSDKSYERHTKRSENYKKSYRTDNSKSRADESLNYSKYDKRKVKGEDKFSRGSFSSVSDYDKKHHNKSSQSDDRSPHHRRT